MICDAFHGLSHAHSSLAQTHLQRLYDDEDQQGGRRMHATRVYSLAFFAANTNDH